MAENENVQEQDQRQFQLQRIYLKDMSFESPNAPAVFSGEWQPKHELNINTKIDKVSDEAYEIVLSVTVTTKTGDQTAFIVEVQQAGLVAVKGFPDAELGPLLGAYCPNLLFPYAREAISDLVTKGSFPQLVLQPVNFDALFAQHQQQVAEQIKQNSGSPTH
jgi:preprotein translocase subunit SecB